MWQLSVFYLIPLAADTVTMHHAWASGQALEGTTQQFSKAEYKALYAKSYLHCPEREFQLI